MESETNYEPVEEEYDGTEHIEGLKLEDDGNLSPLVYNQQHDADNDTVVSGSVYAESDDEDNVQYSLKRPAEDDLLPRQFKRQKGVRNDGYLALLNGDIKDAAHRLCLAPDEGESVLHPTQIGLSYWSVPEKRLFFEAIGRLGQNDLSSIASFIGTKSDVEVNQYLDVLQRARQLRQQAVRRPAIEFSEIPAAVELSQPCCHALDEAADTISVLQERKEELREEGKWGECWEITPEIARQLDNGERIPGSQDLHFKGLFNLQAWLRLSDRIFMNSSIPSENWHYINESPPSMWATTYDDFHSLAVSITKRLVQTTIFISMSRIKAKKELRPTTRETVRAQDVQAAVDSLGLRSNSHQFWSKCARRLRLEVHEEPPDKDEELEGEPLDYEEVEDLLSPQDEDIEPTIDPQVEENGDSSEPESLGADFEEPPLLSDEEDVAVKREADEVLQFSAADFPETYRKKEVLKSRITMERRQEQYAEERDQYANWQAENEMWDLLQKKPPIELPKMAEPGPLQRSNRDVEGIFPIGRDWKSKTKYYSEWEQE
ncbi:unnamed protein product [Fusarium equiseti]|uniref:RNA polymerase I-specific transcription initiation factor rrn5 n=1 Tax=Fusarium equiseti TaxID=61235 RepID=A0A8J2IVJ4_FUSEQ|nr:unnamed protein product [Fusarium equiseti]